MENKHYDFKEAEKKLKEFWEKEKIYKFDSKNLNDKKIYSIDTPPPYISGKMHIGHAFSYSQQDFIARFRRMLSGMIFYPFGTDDNGLPSERFIEKLNNVKSKDLGRAEFIKLCIKTLKEVTPDCIKDFIDLGISADYQLYYSTIDEHSRRISQKSFIDLYKQGEIYHEEFPTIWCCDCQTAIAQAELEDKEIETRFSTLKFKVKETGEDLLIATTRPELLGACVAVFVNPKDKRAKKLKNKKAIVPLFGQEVSILEDDSADLEKGTGLLMICSYGDKFDVEAIKRHKLEPQVILDKKGKLISEKYSGFGIKEARKKILEDLAEKKLITEQKTISHIVNVHDKCGTEIEFIPTKQWFIRVLDKKKKLIEMGNKVKWYPEYMFKRYENWIKGLEWDWNVSRNRHFGVPIPVWECENCNQVILPEEKELPIDPIETKKKCKKCGKEAKPEIMVLDTWATSSLTPQIALNLQGANKKIKIPFSLRPQGHDIIRTWAFYTIVKSLLHENSIPWQDIMISGNVSLGGEKMSKSKGNVVNPREVMEKFGADALRYWAAGSKLGGDLDYLEKDVITGTKFVTKLFNATKFVFMNLKDYNKSKKPKKLLETDRLFLAELNKVIENSTKAFEEYDYARAKLETDKFFWSGFCDNYLEIVKNRVYNGSEEEKESAKYTLYNALLVITKLMAPITPFITEEIYQEFFRKNEKEKSIHISSWPSQFEIKKEKGDEKTWKRLLEIIELVRRAKSEAKKSMKSEIILTLSREDMLLLKEVLSDLKSVSNAKEIKEGKFEIKVLN